MFHLKVLDKVAQRVAISSVAFGYEFVLLVIELNIELFQGVQVYGFIGVCKRVTVSLERSVFMHILYDVESISRLWVTVF